MLDEHDSTHAAVGFGGKKDRKQSDGNWRATKRGAYPARYGDEPILKREVRGAKAAREKNCHYRVDTTLTER